MSRFVTEHSNERPDGAPKSPGYRDYLAALSPADRKKYEGQILAVLESTGEIIAFDRTVELLRKRVSDSPYRGQAWRRVPGPSAEGPIDLEQVAEAQ